jgi:vesicle coat complex subunit
MSEFTQQLVIQFTVRDDDDERMEAVSELENDLEERLNEDIALLDGHDTGSGEMNLFVLTNTAEEAFALIQPMIERRSLLSECKVAYRALEGDSYVVLWPAGVHDFAVK